MKLTPELIINAYASGVFPMAEAADSDEVHWFEPRRRGILPLEGFHVSRSLRRTRRRLGPQFSCNRAFAEVMTHCADREETWINSEITRVFHALHAHGLAHSVEVWSPDGDLAGGVYGLALAGGFFAESMFSRVTDGSKLALAELVARLNRAGFTLLDTQYLTPHLQTLGGIEISKLAYRKRLNAALECETVRIDAFDPVKAADGAVWQV